VTARRSVAALLAAAMLLHPGTSRGAEPLPAGIGSSMVNASADYRDASKAALAVLDSYFLADDRSTVAEIGDEMDDLCTTIRERLLKLDRAMLIELDAASAEAVALRDWKQQQERLWADTCSYGVGLAQLRSEIAEANRQLVADIVSTAKLIEETRKRIVLVKEWLFAAKKAKDWSEGAGAIESSPTDDELDDIAKKMIDLADDVLPLTDTLTRLLLSKSELFKARLRKLDEFRYPDSVQSRLDHPPKSYETAKVFQDHWKVWRDGLKRDRDRFIELRRKYDEVTKSWREERLLQQAGGLAYGNYLLMRAAVVVESQKLIDQAKRLMK